MIAQILILVFFLICDVTFEWRVGDVALTPHLTTVFLLYLGFRRPFSEVVLALLIFVLLSHPFTGLSYLTVFVSHLVVLFTVFRLRGNLFAEAYLTYAVWVLLFSGLLTFLLGVQIREGRVLTAYFDGATELGVNAVWAALLSVPLFIGLDTLFDRQRQARPHEDLFG